MAVRDVKDYLYTVLNQYLEMQEDLKDFEQAFKDGHIPEERLEEVKADVAKLKENYDRIQWIIYLLEIPNKKTKKRRFHKVNKRVEDYFKAINADTDAIIEEDKQIIAKITAELEKITKVK